MHLSGQLSDWSINDLLQIMQVTKKTGSLDIDGERRGRIHFREGLVTGAELTDAKEGGEGTDRTTVADALYVLSTLSSGSLAVGAADGPESSGWSVEDVLADVDILKTLEDEITEAGLFEAEGVRFVQSIDEAITISPEDWSVIVSLVQPFAFSQLETRLGRGGAVRVLHALHRLGVAEATGGEDDGDWLDRLADVAPADSTEPTWVEETPDADPKTKETPAELEPVAATPEPEGEASEPEDAASEPEDEASEPEDEASEPEDASPEPGVRETADVLGVSAPASTILTDGVYDEIRRLRSKVAGK